jgi:hypothetical protein
MAPPPRPTRRPTKDPAPPSQAEGSRAFRAAAKETAERYRPVFDALAAFDRGEYVPPREGGDAMTTLPPDDHLDETAAR